jgi:hypothetical protein
MINSISRICLGFALGVLVTMLFGNTSVRAQIAQSWSKDKVMPIIFVKPGIVGFVPEQGNAIGVSWTKDEVMPVLLVKPYLMGEFVPLEGSSIGNTWLQDQVRPVVFVEPGLGGAFVASASDAGTSSQPTAAAPRGACSAAIETAINGEFNGWNGATVYKMQDGSIWQQSVYHYHYHYAFDPNVLIYPSGSGGCRIKVDGDDDDDGVDVTRLK